MEVIVDQARQQDLVLEAPVHQVLASGEERSQ
jgi:hypothetical protein